MGQTQELPKPNWLNAMEKFESNFMSRCLISADFVDLKEGRIENSRRKRSLLIVFFEFVSIIRFLILFMTKKDSILGYYLGDSLTVYGSIGKAIYFPYFCTAIGAIVMRMTLFFKESSGQLHFMTDFSCLTRGNFPSDMAHFLATKRLKLTDENEEKFYKRINLTYKSMILWTYEVPAVVWLMTTCLTVYSSIYIVPHGFGSIGKEVQMASNSSGSMLDLSPVQVLSAVRGLSLGQDVSMARNISIDRSLLDDSDLGKHFFFALSDDTNWTLKIIIDNLWLIHSAIFLFCFYGDVFYVTHLWYVSVYYLNLRLDQFNDAVRDLKRLSNLDAVISDYYEIYLNRIKLYDNYSKWFICAVNFLANPITCCFIYMVVMKPIPIQGVKILFVIIASNSSFYSIFCTSQAASIHTKARASHAILSSYQLMTTFDPVVKTNVDLKRKVSLNQILI